MITDLRERMLSNYVTGNPGFLKCVEELIEYQAPPMELIYLSINAMGEDVDMMLKVCELVAKTSKQWNVVEKSMVYDKMTGVKKIFKENWKRADVYKHACGLWIAVGKNESFEIIDVLPELLKGFDRHDVGCMTYAACLFAQLVFEVPEIYPICEKSILSLWNTNDYLCEYQCLRCLLNATSVSEDARASIAAAVQDKLYEKIQGSKNRVQSCALGLLQNLLIGSPKRIKKFNSFRPMLESLKLDEPRAISRREACLRMLSSPRYVVFFVAIMISIALWLRSEQALRTIISGTTPLR